MQCSAAKAQEEKKEEEKDEEGYSRSILGTRRCNLYGLGDIIIMVLCCNAWSTEGAE